MWISMSQMKPHQCPSCKTVLNGVSAASVEEPDDPILPKPGDVTICMCCLAVCVFMEDYRLRLANTEEAEYLPDWAREGIAARFPGKPS